MQQNDARAALLLDTIENNRGGDQASPIPDRTTLDAATRAQTSAAGGSDEWIRTRCRIAWDRLLPAGASGSAPARAWLARETPVGFPILIAMAVAFVSGSGIDRLAGAPYLRLVEPAIWAVIVFNLGVYAVLVITALINPGHTTRGIGAFFMATLGRVTEQLEGRPQDLMRLATPAGWEAFMAEWRALSSVVDGARSRAVMHAAAAMLGLGVIAGFYARGLTTDYALGWESTFLNADSMHTLVHWLLGPASAISGVSLPDRETIAELRVVAGGQATGGGAAAALVHLNALSLLLVVVLPRSLLAAITWRQALRQRRNFPLPARLRTRGQARAARAPSGDLGQVVIIVHGPIEAARAKALAVALPSPKPVRTLEVASGDEDGAIMPTAAHTLVFLASMIATPEIETHGRLLARLRQALPAARFLIALDTEPFERRFGQWPARIDERRNAWRAFAEEARVALAMLDLASGDDQRCQSSVIEALAVTSQFGGPPR
jgi:hypothetical protein